MELCQPHDPVSTLGHPRTLCHPGQPVPGRLRPGKVALPGCCGESWEGRAGGDACATVAGSICQWFPGRRECQEVCLSECEPGGDSLMSDRGLCTERGVIPGSQHLAGVCAWAARGSLSRPAAFH